MSAKFYRKLYILLLPLICVTCATPDVDEGVNKLRPNLNTNNNLNIDPNANVAEDNVTELESLVNLPFEPTENPYRQENKDDSASDANGSVLTAVLKFSDSDVLGLTEKLEADSQKFVSKVEPESWFPAELIAKSQISGDETIKGIGYNAGLFYKTPYSQGTITKINETNYFVLVLNTK